MGIKTFYKYLPSHAGRVRFSAFDQYADYLFEERYTAESFPKKSPRERRKLARTDAADAVKRTVASDEFVAQAGVRTSAANPRGAGFRQRGPSGYHAGGLPQDDRLLGQGETHAR